MPPLETLRAELERRGLPRRYVRRACGEVSAHLCDAAEDLEQEGCRPDAARPAALERLGCPSQLAERLYQQCAANSFPLRYPSLVAVALSLAAFVAVAAAGLAAAAGISLADPDAGTRTLNLAIRLAVPTLAAILAFGLLRLFFGSRRPFILCLTLLALLAVTSDVRVEAAEGRLVKVVLRLVR